MSDKTKQFWFVDPRRAYVFSDTIDDDRESAYYHTLVFECGPTQVCAKMSDDGTVEPVQYDPYLIDTTGYRWFSDKAEADAYLASLPALAERIGTISIPVREVMFAYTETLNARDLLDHAIKMLIEDYPVIAAQDARNHLRRALKEAEEARSILGNYLDGITKYEEKKC